MKTKHTILLLFSILFCLSFALAEESIGCTMEEKVCPDGSTVSRKAPSCAFEQCPGETVVACTADAKMCPDGSYVGRTAPKCEFAPCPGETTECETEQDCIDSGECDAGIECTCHKGKCSIGMITDPQLCPTDVKKCRDGSYVGRFGSDCEFAPCRDEPVACTMEAKICPDGSAVGRTGPDCEFAPCPDEPVACTMEVKTCPDGTAVGRTGPDCEFETCPDTGEIIAISDNSGEVIFSGDTRTVTIEKYQASEGESSTGNIGEVVIGSSSVAYRKELQIVESKLVMETSAGQKQISVSPEEAITASEVTETVEAIELTEESAEPVYSVKGEKQARLFWIMPVKMRTETKVSAQTGDVVSVDKPWWSFLAAE